MSSDPSPLSLETVVCARANQVSSRVGDELVVLDLDSSLYFSLDPVGARIFELLDGASIAAVIPLLLWIAGVYDLLRNLRF